MQDIPALVSSWPAVMSTSTSSASPQKVNFTAHYKQWSRPVADDLSDYFKLLQEDFDACNPLAWSLIILFEKFNVLMMSYPSLGSVVDVGCIFSGGHDTISLCRASLKPETICTLMLVKQCLHLALEVVKDIVVCWLVRLYISLTCWSFDKSFYLHELLGSIEMVIELAV